LNNIFKPSQTQRHQQTGQPTKYKLYMLPHDHKQNKQTPPPNRTDGRHKLTEQTDATNKQNKQTPAIL
jgi:hypothetical protein